MEENNLSLWLQENKTTCCKWDTEKEGRTKKEE
jgi:hypothetical protein